MKSHNFASVSDFSSFFDLETPSFGLKVNFSAHLFYTRLKTTLFSPFTIIHNDNGKGKLLLGVLPDKTDLPKLLDELTPGSLIVSCNEAFELSGAGSIFNMVPPSSWRDAGLEHYHLPLEQDMSKWSPALCLQAIEKMRKAWEDKRCIYIHSDSGQARSQVMTVLFYHLVISPDNTLTDTLASLKTHQINLPPAEIEFAQRVINAYIALNQQDIAQNKNLLSSFCQAPEFKDLWHFAYTHPSYFDAIKTIIFNLHENPLTTISRFAPSKPLNKNQTPFLNRSSEKLEDISLESPLNEAIEKLKKHEKGGKLLANLCECLTRIKANKPDKHYDDAVKAFAALNAQLTDDLNNHVIEAARNVQAATMVADASIEEKTDWINQTANFLSNPWDSSEDYLTGAQRALGSTKTTHNHVGRCLINLTCVLLLLTVLLTVGSGGSLLAPAVAIAIAVELVVITAGYLLVNARKNAEVSEMSESLRFERTH